MDPLTGDLATARVSNLLLGDGREDDPRGVVGRLLAVQAQEHAFSRWSVAQRTARPDEAELLGAIERGEIVRTHVLRPTWHYVLAEDLRWLQGLTGERVRQLSAGWYRNHGVDQELLDRTRALVEGALSGGNAMTRDALRAVIESAGVDVSGQRMTAVMSDLELLAVVCSGPVDGRHHTYALVEERLPPAPALSVEEATAELVRRYLAGHGPATLKDLRWWSTLTLKQLRRGLEDLGDDVIAETVAGDEYLWLASASLPGEPAQDPRFQLLQVFDELFVGYAETRGLVDPDGEYGSILPLGFSKMMHVVLEGDRLAGRWRSDRRGDRLDLTLSLDRPLSPADVTRLELAAADYGAFVGKEVGVELVAERTR